MQKITPYDSIPTTKKPVNFVPMKMVDQGSMVVMLWSKRKLKELQKSEKTETEEIEKP